MSIHHVSQHTDLPGACRSQLSQALASTSRKWASHIAAEESERLTPIVEALSTRHEAPVLLKPARLHFCWH